MLLQMARMSPTRARQSSRCALGSFVFDVAGVDLCVVEREPSGDEVLLCSEEVEGDGAGGVGLHELGAFIAERVGK